MVESCMMDSSHPVKLHVYDLSGGMAAQHSKKVTGHQIPGIWQTGIAVYGKEFYYGCGISYDKPGCTPFGTPTQVYDLGSTEIPEELFMELLKEAASRFTTEGYNLLTHNCNHFSDQCSEMLLGTGISTDLVDQMRAIFKMPGGQQFAQPIFQACASLMKQSNTLFSDSLKQVPIKLRVQQQPGAKEESDGEDYQNMMGNSGSMARQESLAPADRPASEMPLAELFQRLQSNPQAMANLQQQMQRNPRQAQSLMAVAQTLSSGGQVSAEQEQQARAVLEELNGSSSLQAPTQPQQDLGPGNTNPQPGDLVQIVNNAHLMKLVQDYPAVVVDFWSQTCPPCIRFKPIFEAAASGNRNKKVVFAMVNCDQVHDCAREHSIRALPTFKFFLEGEVKNTMQGANEPQFRKHLNELHEATSSKAFQHMSMQFLEFKPQNRKLLTFPETANLQKMKEAIQKICQSTSGVRMQAFTKWLETGDITQISPDAISQLVDLFQANTTEDKQKVALCDLLRLLVLQENTANYLLGKHWPFVHKSVFSHLMIDCDITKADDKVVHNMHYIGLKFVANFFATDSGQKCIGEKDGSKAVLLGKFLVYSLGSASAKTVLMASIVLFNLILSLETFDTSSKVQTMLNEQVHKDAMKAIDTCLGNKALDTETLQTLLMSECRILYRNQDMCAWVEEQFTMFFKETHKDLSDRVNDQLKKAVQDVTSMVDIDEKK